jgi:hypothetical protein
MWVLDGLSKIGNRVKSDNKTAYKPSKDEIDRE